MFLKHRPPSENKYVGKSPLIIKPYFPSKVSESLQPLWPWVKTFALLVQPNRSEIHRITDSRKVTVKILSQTNLDVDSFVSLSQELHALSLRRLILGKQSKSHSYFDCTGNNGQQKCLRVHHQEGRWITIEGLLCGSFWQDSSAIAFYTNAVSAWCDYGWGHRLGNLRNIVYRPLTETAYLVRRMDGVVRNENGACIHLSKSALPVTTKQSPFLPSICFNSLIVIASLSLIRVTFWRLLVTTQQPKLVITCVRVSTSTETSLHANSFFCVSCVKRFAERFSPKHPFKWETI